MILDINPRHPAAFGALASLLWQTRDLARCRALCEQALAAAPDNPTAHYYLALVYLNENDLPTARGHYQHYLRFAPPNSPRIPLLEGERP